MTERKTILIEISQDIADEMSQLANDSRKLLNPFYEEIVKTGIFFYKKSCTNATSLLLDCQKKIILQVESSKKNNTWDDLQ